MKNEVNEVFECASSNLDFLFKIIRYNISDKYGVAIYKVNDVYELYSIKKENDK